jgi:hypothetical protein
MKFTSIAKVHKYLIDKGWQVSQRAVYNHFKEGKLRKKQGAFSVQAVNLYARSFLIRKDSGQTAAEEERVPLQQQKLSQEIKKLEIQNQREEFKFDVEKGKYLPKDDFELELAARASVFEAGFRYFFQSMSAEIITLVEGNMKKVPELIAMLNERLDEQLNEYASTKEYQVMILGAKEDEKKHDK